MNIFLLSTFIFAFSDPGCEKDTDCKGDRICDADSRSCKDPVYLSSEDSNQTTESEIPDSVKEEMEEIFEEGPEPPTQPEIAPQVEEERFQYSPRYALEPYHPYLGGGISCLIIGTIGIGSGAAILASYTKQLTLQQ